MTCEHVKLPGGGHAIVCGVKRKRCACGRPATLECDWKVETRKSGTCDAPICRRCALAVGPNKDLCAKHAEAFALWKAKRAATVPGDRPD